MVRQVRDEVGGKTGQLQIDQIIQGNCFEVLNTLPDQSVHCCVTSPPYWGLRDYGLPATEWPEVTYTPMAGLPAITVPTWTGCLGLEPTPEMFVGHMVLVFRGVRRVLRDDGTLWINFGDTFCSTAPGTMGDNFHIQGALEATKRARKIERRKIPTGLKPKDLVGIPWRVAFALQADGWYLRMDNIWHKPNSMPESVTDRPTKAHEYIFLLSKSQKYYYDAEAVKEPAVGTNFIAPAGSAGAFGPEQLRRRKGNTKTFDNEANTQGRSFNNSNLVERENLLNESGLRNRRSVWTVSTHPYSDAHFATFPEKLIYPCILAGSPQGGIVFDPFGGSGTVAVASKKLGRKYLLIEMNPEYIETADKRIRKETAQMNFFELGI